MEVCRHPANELLPWYANGSLEKDEESVVRSHVEGCTVCGRELDDLLQVSRALNSPQRYAVDERSRFEAARRSATRAYALAACLTLPALLGIVLVARDLWRDVLPRQPGPGAGAAAPGPSGVAGTAPRLGGVVPAALLDLGSGPTRGPSMSPVLDLPPGAGTVTILVNPPVRPDRRYLVALRGPAGRVLSGPSAGLRVDGLGRLAFSIEATAFDVPGEYAVEVRDAAPGATERPYLYRFQVRGPGESAGR